MLELPQTDTLHPIFLLILSDVLASCIEIQDTNCVLERYLGITWCYNKLTMMVTVRTVHSLNVYTHTHKCNGTCTQGSLQ